MRHGFATQALGSGVDLKTVSTILEHSTVSTTANVYLHPLEALQRDAAIRIDSLLGDKVTSASKQAGKLSVALTLTCERGRYSGWLSTPVGPFAITAGSFDGSILTLQFAARGHIGTLTATVAESRIDGTFGSDSGPVTLHATTSKQPPEFPTLHLSPAQWRDDLGALSRGLRALHPNPFRFISSAAFTDEVTRLDGALAHMSGDETYFSFDQIANSIGDAHTYVTLPPDDANLPIDIQRFGSEYRVIDASTSNAAAVGTRVLAIDGVRMGTVRGRLLTITPVPENDAFAREPGRGFHDGRHAASRSRHYEDSQPSKVHPAA